MSTVATSPAQTPGPGRGLPRWAWEVIVLLVVIAVAAVAVAVVAVQGKDASSNAAPPVSTTPPATSPAASTPAPTPSTSMPAEAADGCLGGATELNQAVLAAQQKARLDPVGAASFTATLVRWAMDAPAPPFQAQTAKQILTADASSKARHFLSGTIKDLKGSTSTIDINGGRYYVEAFDGTSAIVSYLVIGHSTLNGAVLSDVELGGSVHLKSINGLWRFQDMTGDRSLEDLHRIGTPYSGGC